MAPGGRPWRARTGAALATALFALVIMAALADAILAPALARQRAARRLAAHHAAESEAERALGAVAGGWSVARWKGLGVGAESVTVADVSVDGIASPGVHVETRVRRLGPVLFRVGVGSSAPLPGASAAAYRSLLLELVKDTVQLAAAVTAGGDVELGAGTVIDAADDCDPADPSAEPEPVVIVAHPEASVTRGGTPTDEGKRDAAARSALTYQAPAGLGLAHLAGQAAVKLAGGATVSPAPRETMGHCVAEPSNWGGTPPAACSDYAPVVLGNGDLRIQAGAGQGALLVEGRLIIEGPFHYRGLIVATGGIETTGGPVIIDGAVFTGPAGDARFHDAAVVTVSRCALQAPAEATARVVVVPTRGWWR